MSGYVRNARIKIVIDGQLRPYSDGRWVIFRKDNFPIGFMLMERKHLTVTEQGYKADPEKAFTDFWSWNDMTPLKAAMEGYRIALRTAEGSQPLLDQHTSEWPSTERNTDQ